MLQYQYLSERTYFMSINPMISLVESNHLKKNVPVLTSGDVVRVHQKIVEAGKARIQIFEGLVISVSGSRGMDGSFTVRRIASGVGVERVFPLHSPKIAKIERVKSSRVRRAKIYYIRELTGRKARLKSDTCAAESWEEGLAVEEPVKDEETEGATEPQTEDFETVEQNDATGEETLEEVTDKTESEKPPVEEIEKN